MIDKAHDLPVVRQVQLLDLARSTAYYQSKSMSENDLQLMREIDKLHLEHPYAGEDRAILAARHALYPEARQRNPNRWSRHTRNWEPIGVVTLNPERDSLVNMTSRTIGRQPLAA